MIHWEKDGSVFSLEEGRRIINSTGRSTLEIKRLLVSDAGVYSCSVSNVGGMDSRSVRLEVRGEGVYWNECSDYLLSSFSHVLTWTHLVQLHHHNIS